MPGGSIRIANVDVAFSASTGDFTRGVAQVRTQNAALQASFIDLSRPVAQFTELIRSSLIATVAYAVGVNALFGGIRRASRAFLDFESGLTAVQKTANLTADETERLGQNFNALLTQDSRLGGPLPIARQQLLEVAEVAGQMNITGVRDITAFSEAAAAMGVTTDLAGARSANALGLIIANTDAAASSTLGLASAITFLGNANRGGESEVLAIAEELARGAAQFDVAASDLLAIAATLSHRGVQPEAAGSAFQRIFQALQEAANDAIQGNDVALRDIVRFVDESYGTLEERVQALLSTIQGGDFVGGLRFLLQALDRAGPEAAGGVIVSLTGERNVRDVRFLAALSEEQERLAVNTRQAARELIEQTAIVQEFALFSDDARQRLQLVGNQLEEQFTTIGRPLTTAFVAVAENFRAIEVLLAGVLAATVSAYGTRRITQYREAQERVAQSIKTQERNLQDQFRTARIARVETERDLDVRNQQVDAAERQRIAQLRVAQLDQEIGRERQRRTNITRAIERETGRVQQANYNAARTQEHRLGTIQQMRVVAQQQGQAGLFRRFETTSREEERAARFTARRHEANLEAAQRAHGVSRLRLADLETQRTREQEIANTQVLSGKQLTTALRERDRLENRLVETRGREQSAVQRLVEFGRQQNRDLRLRGRLLRGLTGFYNLIGGLPGLLITAGTVLGALFFNLRQRADELKDRVDGIVEGLNQAVERTGEAGQLSDQGNLIRQAEQEVRRIQEQLVPLIAQRSQLQATAPADDFFGEVAPIEESRAASRIAALDAQIERLEESLASAREAFAGTEAAGTDAATTIAESFRRLNLDLNLPEQVVRQFEEQLFGLVEGVNTAEGLRQQFLRSIAGERSPLLRNIDTAVFEQQLAITQRIQQAEIAVRDARERTARATENVAAAQAERDRIGDIPAIGAEAESQLNRARETLVTAQQQEASLARQLELYQQIDGSTASIVAQERARRQAEIATQRARPVDRVFGDFFAIEREVQRNFQDIQSRIDEREVLAQQERQILAASNDFAREAFRARFEIENEYNQQVLAAQQELLESRTTLSNEQSRLASIQAQLESARDDQVDALVREERRLRENIAALRVEVAVRSDAVDVINVEADAIERLADRSAALALSQQRSPFQQYLDEIRSTNSAVTDLGRTFEETAVGGLRAFGDEMANITEEGSINFGRLAETIVQELTRVLVQAVIVANILRALGIGGTAPGGAIIPGIGSAGVTHEGGIVGRAPRYRSMALPLRPNERHMILEKGEEVLPEWDPRHRRNIRGQSMESIRAWIGRLPRFHQGGVVGAMAGGGFGGGGPHTIRLINETSTPVQIDDGGQEFDGAGFVQNVIIRDVQRNGPVTQSLAVAMRRMR